MGAHYYPFLSFSFDFVILIMFEHFCLLCFIFDYLGFYSRMPVRSGLRSCFSIFLRLSCRLLQRPF